MDLDAAKRAAGTAAAAAVRDGMRVGLGTGSTAYWFIVALGELVSGGLRVVGVPTSLASASLARERGITLTELDERGVDLAVDGADAVDPRLRLIKGRGGAMVREKIVAAAAQRFVVVVDDRKLVEHLSGRVPVELMSFGAARTLAVLAETGMRVELRRDVAGEAVRSDNGNLIADGELSEGADVAAIAAHLDALPGVVGHGLFLDMTDAVIVGSDDGTVRQLAAPDGPAPQA